MSQSIPPAWTRRHWLTSAAAAGAAALAGPGAARAAGRQAPARPAEIIDAGAYGARSDGKTDDTAAITRALQAAAKRGGIVCLGPFAYRIDASLDVPDDVALQGIYRGPTSHAKLAFSHDAYADPPGRGTVLLATGNRGKADAPPLVTLHTNSALLGTAIYHPRQNYRATPVPYPWAVRLAGENATVENVELINPWHGIDARRAHRHLIRNVTGQPLRLGILVDDIFDIGRIENVHFNPWWRQSRPVLEFMYRHGEAFVFGRADWEYVLNTFCFGYAAGYRFMDGKHGSCNGNFLGIGADASLHAVVVEQTQQPGLLITNGEFVSFDYLKLRDKTLVPVQVVVEKTHAGAVRFANCSFWGPGEGIARAAGGGSVGFNACTFVQWKPGQAAIAASAARLFISGCEFRQAGPHINLAAGVKAAVITGNIFAGARGINNTSGGNVQIGLNSWA